jgi:hypothetical protein
MAFRDDTGRFASKVMDMMRRLHEGVAEEALQSIVGGHPVTGAPGQPVDMDILRRSWRIVKEAPWVRRIISDVDYAPIIEDGTRAGRKLTLRSAVGGFHSVKLTRAAWGRLVEWVAAQVRQGAR